jgi:DNA polymerase III subunit delta
MPARPGSVPITLVLGEEDLLAERAVAEAVAAAIERLGPGTSVEEVRAGALPDGFAMGLATPSLFGGGRVVVVQEADALDQAARDAVLALAADAGAGAAVVLRAAGTGRQARFFKEVQRQAATVLVARLKPSERASWLRAEVRRLGRKADEAAGAALLDTVGQDLRELAGAVEKLHVAVPPPAVLTAGHVAEFLSQTADRGIFELTDAVLAADAATALDRLDAMFAQGEDPIGLLGMLARQLRLLLRVADHAGEPASQVAQALGGGVRDWQVERARRQARNFRPEALRRGLDAVAEADAQVRNGNLPSRVLLELVVARLAGSGTPPRTAPRTAPRAASRARSGR